MSTDPRWTSMAEILVGRALSEYATLNGFRMRSHRDGMAQAALTAIADAGLLLPRNVDRDEQRGVLNPQTGQVSRCPGRDCEHTEEEQQRARVRTFVSFTTPWTEVEIGSQS